MKRIGLILAAGRGRRMGRTKQLVPWRTTTGQKPLVAAAFDAICSVCNEMVVVLGHDADAVASALGGKAFQRVMSNPDAEMFDSIRAGLAEAQRIDAGASVLLQPGDHPEVAADTLAAILNAASENPEQAILPQHGSRGGHPLLIPPPIIALLLTSDCPNGLGRFWLDHPELCVRLPVNDASVIVDIDTPDQLQRP